MPMCCVYTCGALTATRNYALQILNQHKVPIAHDVLVTSSDVTRGKPHPEPYLKGPFARNSALRA